MTTDEALKRLAISRAGLYAHLKSLEGQERREGIRDAIEGGVRPTELAKGLGISRGRLYQLTDKKETR